jgi:hypothetical protein
MAHGKLRSEKTCLNCGAEVPLVYCPSCGQMNREPKFNVRDLIMDFVHDFTHFDSKFFRTTLLLITKPGFLTKEFIEGKRLKYLNPVRMYVFTSAIFFFFLYAVSSNSDNEVKVQSSDFIAAEDTVDLNSSTGFTTVKAYEESQSKLPAEKKDNWIKKWSVKQEIRLVDKFKNDSKGTIAGIQKEFVKNLPSLMFVSLPFLAMFLQLIYIRRKSFSYVDHLLFLIHFYIFSFILSFFFVNALVLTSFDWLAWMGWVATAIMIWINIYPLLAMKNFYQHRWGGAIFRYIIFVFGAFLIFLFLFIIYLILSLLRV